MLSCIFQTASRSRPLLVQNRKSSLTSLFHLSAASNSSSKTSSSSSSCSALTRKICCWPNTVSSSHTFPLLHQTMQCCFMGTKATIKTHKGAAKRFRVRGSGSIKRNKGGVSHNSGYKTRQRCNRLGQTDGIKEPSIEKRIRRLLAE